VAFSSSRFLPCCQGSKRHEEGGTRPLAANTLPKPLRQDCQPAPGMQNPQINFLRQHPQQVRARPGQFRSDQGAGDNTVLDIAKIESGQFSVNIGEYAIGSIVETVRAAAESLAAP